MVKRKPERSAGRLPLVFTILFLATSSPVDLKMYLQSCGPEPYARVFVATRPAEEPAKKKHDQVNPVLTSVAATAPLAQATTPKGNVAPPEPSYPEGSARNGEALFEQLCAHCHAIGGESPLGPDLRGVTERRPNNWLIEFILSPSAMLEQDDPIARSLLAEWKFVMPDTNVTREEAVDILAYIEVASEPPPEEQLAAPPEEAPQMAPTTGDIPLGSATDGYLYFTGRKGFENRAPSCEGCHSIASLPFPYGGNLGPELTGSYEKFGPQALSAGLKSVPWRVMTAIYPEKALTQNEITDLVAFFREVSGRTPPPDITFLLALPLAGGGLVFAFLLVWAVWRSRIRKVRQTLVKQVNRARKTVA